MYYNNFSKKPTVVKKPSDKLKQHALSHTKKHMDSMKKMMKNGKLAL